ncbi:MAG: hypothetical protein AAF430_19120 [Myxococcota bacterium]
MGRGLIALSMLLFGAGSALAGSALDESRLPAGDCAGVYWDWVARFETGDRIEVRVLWTARGPGAPIAAAQGVWIDADGVQAPFRNGRRAGRYSAEHGGDALRIGSSEQTLARGETPQARFSVDNDKRGVKVALETSARVPAPLDLDLGFADWRASVLHADHPTTAQVWRRGMPEPRRLSGNSSLIRTTHAPCERERIRHRVDVHGDGALWVHVVAADGASRAAGIVRGAEGTWRRAAIAPSRWRAWQHDANGAWPGRLEFGDHAVDLKGGLRTTRPLDALPLPLRWLYAWGEAPVRRLHRARLHHRADGAEGADAIASFTFVTPPPVSSREPEAS